MVTVSDEYCSRCGKQQPVVEETDMDYITFRCLECGHVMDMLFDDRCYEDDDEVHPLAENEPEEKD